MLRLTGGRCFSNVHYRPEVLVTGAKPMLICESWVKVAGQRETGVFTYVVGFLDSPGQAEVA